jgi:hypothetical protein
VRVEPLQSAVPTFPGAVIGPFLSQPLIVEENGLDTDARDPRTQESRVIVGVGDTAYADRIGSRRWRVNWQIFRAGQAVNGSGIRRSAGLRGQVHR